MFQNDKPKKLELRLFVDLKERPAFDRLRRLALLCEDYAHFESIITDNTSWFLRTVGMRHWKKDQLKRFYALRKNTLKNGGTIQI